MPLQNVTKKRKGKASTRKASASMMKTIQILRATFFLIIGLAIVFLYISYESGSLVNVLKSMNLADIYQSWASYIRRNPLTVTFFASGYLAIFGVGYVIGKKRR